MFVVVALFTSCAGSADDEKVIEYAAADLVTGEAVSLTTLRGGPVLLSSWATWCEPCKEELPKLEALYQQRVDDGLQMVAVNVNAAGPAEREIDNMVEQLGLTMPTWRDDENRFTVVFGGMGVPTNVLIGADGRVIQKWLGAVDVDDPAFIAAINAAVG
jgi:cytochrome c-type biogenesis protein